MNTTTHPQRSQALHRLPERIRRAFAGLGFGAAQFGNLGRPTEEESCLHAADLAWERGLRYFDTAPHYGLGLSERRLGRALAARPREESVISTKVGRLLRQNPSPTGSDAPHGFHVPDDLTRIRDYTAAGVLRSLEESLTRLGTDAVDILWIHDPEESEDRVDEALTGAAPALERLREEGVISAWGVGSKDAAVLRRFVEESSPDLLMVSGRYTLLEQEQVGLMSACMREDVGVVAVSVFNSGLLAREEPADDAWYEYGPAPEHILARARALAAVAREHGVTLPGAALAFPLRHPAVVNVMAGMRSPEHVRRNLALRETPIPDDFWNDLQARGLLKEEA